MTRLLAVVVFLFSSVPAFAMPEFLQMFRSDPFRNPAFDGCITCHMSPQGGDARNVFGQAFESGGETITTMLRAQFPDRFIYPVSRVSDGLTIHFSDPDKKQVVVEAGGMRNLVDVDKRTVNGTAAVTPNAPAAPAGAAAQITPARSSEVPVDTYAREGAFFGSNIVNLPDGKPQKAGGVDFWIGHRFGQDVHAAGLGGLFGFDSGAAIAYGVRTGITDRLSVLVFRTSSALRKTISLGSALQISRQSPTVPLTSQLRFSVDGEQNFGLYDKEKNPAPRQYSPVIQVITTRTFKDRVSLTAVPSFAFNTRNEANTIELDVRGREHNDTIALGLGAGVRFLRSTSLVGEYIPRLWGFRGDPGGFIKETGGRSSGDGAQFRDRPGVSIGLQKSTLRHTFELLISRQLSMTPAQYSLQGNDRFRVGFNIYRKIR